jgi:hypothetical protein
MGAFVAPAHCFFDFALKGGKTKQPKKSYRVVLPRISYQWSTQDPESRSFKIRKIVRHPEVSNRDFKVLIPLADVAFGWQWGGYGICSEWANDVAIVFIDIKLFEHIADYQGVPQVGGVI